MIFERSAFRQLTPHLGLCVVLATATACAAPPPAAPSPQTVCPTTSGALIDVASLAPTIRTDLRYATRDNFTGEPLPGYAAPRALLRPDAAASLARVQERLRAQGRGLLIWDAYRPVQATLAMVEWAEESGNEWVLDQGYVARRSGHNLGNTVDLTVIDLETGTPLEMGTEYDTFSEASHTANAAGQVRENRMLLVEVMAAEGWSNYDKEWWHFSFPGEFQPLDLPHICFD